MDIDKRFLTRAELSHYEDLLDPRNPVEVGPNWQFKVVRWTWVALAVWIVAVAVLGVQIAGANAAHASTATPGLLLALTMSVGIALVFLILWGETKKAENQWRSEQAAAYLVEIGYSRRRQSTPSRSSDDDTNRYWMTGGYDPDRYYSYRQSERDLMQTFGMDADEWDANMND